jgi:hypothetical protein
LEVAIHDVVVGRLSPITHLSCHHGEEDEMIAVARSRHNFGVKYNQFLPRGRSSRESLTLGSGSSREEKGIPTSKNIMHQ